jgi:hypothetical protein
MRAEGEPQHPPGDPPGLLAVAKPDGDAALSRHSHLLHRALGREIQVPGHGGQHDQPRQRDDHQAHGQQRRHRHAHNMAEPDDH